MTIYTQLTLDERILMMRLRWQGLSFITIGQLLGRHRRTIYGEFECHSYQHIDGGYRPTKAERRTRARRSRSRRNRHDSERDFAIVRTLLRKDWSPEKITGYQQWLDIRAISHEKIYQTIWRDKAYDSRGRLAGKRNISERHNRTSASLNKKTTTLIKRDLIGFKTITADNGAELNQYKTLEKDGQTRFYFANPYHP